MNKNLQPSSIRKYSIRSDYKLSFTLIFQNFLPIFIVLAIGVVLNEVLDYLFLDVLFPELPFNQYGLPPGLLYFLSNLPGDAIFYGFFGVCMGLCSEIMSSGDQFTQVKRFPYYLKKFWLKFFALGLVINFPFYLAYFIRASWVNPVLFITLWALSHFVYYFLVEINPALITRSKFREAIKDNIFLLKSQFLRILITFGIITLVFSSPLIILRSLEQFGSFSDADIEILHFLHRLFNYIKIFIGNPLNAFLSIGIYNENIVFPTLQSKK
ncbi:hypothetical protein DSAG12_03194 [Promethearchaeum syntrophicum]|uniref:Uncharacterized protein n=1 Tax=Promethearchaeum syntrophicum TaxID=2594042 RepID=A0A5B9DED6_9ARCH|nr:hypothetical protein [Candidatus Prometheoarchaeum syntrophicum]